MDEFGRYKPFFISDILGLDDIRSQQYQSPIIQQEAPDYDNGSIINVEDDDSDKENHPDLLVLEKNTNRPRAGSIDIYQKAGPSGIHGGVSDVREEVGASGVQLQDVPSTSDDEEYINVVDDDDDLQTVPKSDRHLDIACKVCGDHATGRHYGIFACDGCAGFFKRAIRNKMYLRCRNTGYCVINKTRRNYCKKCRLDRCFKAGMSLEFAQHDRGPRASTRLKQMKEKETHLYHAALDLAYPQHLLSEFVHTGLPNVNYRVPLPYPAPVPILPQPNLAPFSGSQNSMNVFPQHSYYVPRYHYP